MADFIPYDGPVVRRKAGPRDDYAPNTRAGGNPFDQFDAPAANPFDQFDNPAPVTWGLMDPNHNPAPVPMVPGARVPGPWDDYQGAPADNDSWWKMAPKWRGDGWEPAPVPMASSAFDKAATAVNTGVNWLGTHLTKGITGILGTPDALGGIGQAGCRLGGRQDRHVGHRQDVRRPV